jgi:hypothetical protein
MSALLDQNLKQLAFIDPELADRMRALPSSSAVRVVPTRAGVPSASALCFDGVEVALHSLQDPLKQASRFIEGLQINPQVDAFAMIGMGMGYHVAELIRRVPPERHVLVIESREDVFRAALESRDLSPILGRAGVRVFVGTDYVGFLDWLKTFLNESSADSLSVLRHMESYRLNPAFYGQITLEMEKAVSRRRVELNTLVTFGPELESNVIRNLPFVVSAVGVERFRDAWKGRPAILAGAGPSLTQALPHLRAIQDRALIVVADTATKLVLREGIRPHFTALLDMTPKTRKFFDGLKAEEAPALIFDPDACHETVRDYPGPRVTFESIVPWTRWAAEIGGPKGFMEKGISVVHTGFLFLRVCGADPIILVGVDLAFPGKTTHAEGVELGWGTGEVTEDLEHQVRLPSVTGGQVLSVVAFKTFVTVFEILIAQASFKVVNTTPAGALLRGAENLPIEEALRRYVGGGGEVREAMAARLADAPALDRERFRAQGRRLLDSIRQVALDCGAALRRLKQMERLDRTNPVEREDFTRLARKVNKHRLEILGMKEVLPLLQRPVSGEALEVRRLTKEIREAKDEAARHALEQKRMVLFFAAYLKSADHIARELERTLAGAAP